jgi:hypothetical protein
MPETFDEWLEYWCEWVAAGVWDDPAIETRVEFKEAVKQVIQLCLRQRVF